MKIDPVRRFSIEDVPGAPAWFDQYLQLQNPVNENYFSALNGGISIENTIDQFVTVDLDHGVQTRVKNPFGKTMPIGMEPVRCIGVELGANGQPDRTLYDLAMPRIDWKPAGTDASQLLVTATYPLTKSGAIGDFVSSFVLFANAVTLTSPNVANITSVSVPAGDWNVDAIGMLDGALTGTLFRLAVSTTSATLSTSGDSDVQTPTVSTAAADVALNINGYRIQLAAATTVYLVAKAIFSAGTAKAYGRINFRRMVDAYTISAPRGRVTLRMYGG